MPAFKLIPDPTFKAQVQIPVHGGQTVPVEFTFKHRTRDQLDEFFKGVGERSVEDSILDAAVGWSLDDEFTAENIKLLCENYMGAPAAIASTYTKELMQNRQGN